MTPDTETEKMAVELPRTMWRRIDTVLEPGESRDDFIREAVRNELQRPERRSRPG